MFLLVVVVQDLDFVCVNFVLIQPTGLGLDRRLWRAVDRFFAIASNVCRSLILRGRGWQGKHHMSVYQSVVLRRFVFQLGRVEAICSFFSAHVRENGVGAAMDVP